MGKRIHSDVIDLALEHIRDAGTLLCVCRGEPADMTEAQPLLIAARTIDNSDYLGPVDNDQGGRKITVKSQQRIRATASGVASHVLLSDGSRVLFTTTCKSLAIRKGDRITVPRWDIDVEGPQ
jgi:hypothetical protein